LQSQKTRWELLREYGEVAQLVEHRTENPCVGGSSPPFTTKNPLYTTYEGFFTVGYMERYMETHFKYLTGY
jgi:hypothetical protein